MTDNVTLNEREQCYAIEGEDALGFTECINRVERYSIELAARGALPDRFIDDPVTSQRGTLAAYEAMKMLQGELVDVLIANEDTGMADLSPDLVGLEGQTVVAVTTDGESREFVVGRSDDIIPVSLELNPDGSQRVADRFYESVEVVTT